MLPLEDIRESASSVKSGKKIAMGGSLTDTTQATTLKTPYIRELTTHSGAPIPVRAAASQVSSLKS